MEQENKNVITSKSLEPKDTIVLPEAKVDTSATGLINNATAGVQPVDQEIELLKQKSKDDTEQVSNLMKEVGLVEAKQSQFEEELGASKINDRIRTLDAQILSQSQGLRDYKDELYRNPNLTQTLASRLFTEQERKTSSDLANLSITKSILRGDYDSAIATAKRKVEMETAPLRAEIEGLKFVIDNNKQFQTAEFNSLLNKKQKELDREIEDKEKSEEMIVNAQQGNAPQSLIDKARKVLESGGKRNDVSNILGKYGLTLADRLDLEIKRKTLDKLEQELNKSNPDFGELVKINGKDYIRYKDGTISEPVLPEAKDTEVVVSRLDNKIKEIDRLTAFNGGVGLATSAGSLRGAPIPFLFKGKINDWRANIKNLTSKLTVDELGRVKSDGVTFGQLSNGERLAVGEAATALNAAMITRGSGDDKKATGRFKMSEPEVLRQLNIIKDAYLLDFERRTGVNYAEYQANPDVLKNKLADEFIDKYETALEVNNYGGYPID